MSWFRVDDMWADSPKVDSISDVAARLWTICGTWCSKKENLKLNGFVPRAALQTITKRRWSDEVIELAVVDLVETSKLGGFYESGLWEPVEGGWLFHDWDEYKPRDSDEPELTPQESGRIGGLKSAEVRREKSGTAVPVNARNRTKTEGSPKAFDEGPTEGPSVKPLRRVTEATEAPDPDPVPIRSDQPKNSIQRPDRSTRDDAPPAALSAVEDSGDEVEDEEPPPSAVVPSLAAVAPSGAPTLTPRGAKTSPRASSCHLAFARSLSEPKATAVELFGAWRDESGKTGARYDHTARELFEGLLDAGETPERVRDVVRGAKLDDWARDTAKLAAPALLRSSSQREKFIELAKHPPRPKGSKAPKQPSTPGGFGAEFLAARNGGVRS